MNPYIGLWYDGCPLQKNTVIPVQAGMTVWMF
jgi:hypothetical protein